MDNIDKYKNYVLANDVTIRQLQDKLLEIFMYFKKICEDNGLNYWCGGGTMLGAVRHGGFIPWDDDLDVFMPRKDYESLYKIWNTIADTDHYALVRTDRSHNYHHTAMNLVDLKTTFIQFHSENEDIYHGCYIDVIPFEGCPDGRLSRAFQIYHSIMYSVFNCQRLPNNQGRMLRYPVMLLLGMIKSQKLRYKLWTYHQKQMTRYDFYTANIVKETVSSFKGLFREYDRHVFDTTEILFEGVSVKIPVGYDHYMKKIYGDYMKVPDDVYENMSGRYSRIKFIDLKNSFKIYKGLQYLKIEKK